ncbi:hypothetical protein V8E54_009118 [Elaphomyces granulatus]
MLLKGVDKELLRDDLGLKVAGDRFKVLNAIEYLRQSSVKYANSGKVQALERGLEEEARQSKRITGLPRIAELAGLSYRDPLNGFLLNTAGSSWEYQASDELKRKLRNHIYRHHHCFVTGRFDKKNILLYLFLSGSGTGKSCNAREFHKLAAQCFDGTYTFDGLKFQYQERMRSNTSSSAWNLLMSFM